MTTKSSDNTDLRERLRVLLTGVYEAIHQVQSGALNIVWAVVFFGSASSDFITDQILTLDGGMSMS